MKQATLFASWPSTTDFASIVSLAAATSSSSSSHNENEFIRTYICRVLLLSPELRLQIFSFVFLPCCFKNSAFTHNSRVGRNVKVATEALRRHYRLMSKCQKRKLQGTIANFYVLFTLISFDSHESYSPWNNLSTRRGTLRFLEMIAYSMWIFFLLLIADCLTNYYDAFLLFLNIIITWT